MNIIFMGTSEFGLPTLMELVKNPNYNLLAIYTKEPSISGRGQKLNYSPIHQFANEKNLKIFTPKTLKTPETQEEFRSFNADLAVVVSYGLILPKAILNATKYGCFNIHPSKLPLYRGSAPLQRSIMNLENESAVCIIKMDEGIDSGDIVLSEDFNISLNENFSLIQDKTAKIGAKLMVNAIEAIKQNSLKFSSQNHHLATYAKKIAKEEAKINWNLTCQEISGLIRGLSGNLGAFFVYKNENFKILECDYKIENSKDQNGKIINNLFHIKCNNGIIIPKILQKPGKNPLPIKDFLNGLKPEINLILN